MSTLSRFASGIVLLTSCAYFLSASAAPNSQDEMTQLEEVQNGDFDQTRIKPNGKLAGKKIFIRVSGISFDDDWSRDFQNLERHYKERIQKDYAELLLEQLRQGLVKSGYEIVGSEADADGVLDASLSDLRINGPELDVASQIFVHNAGSATLNLTLLDHNNQALMQVIDNRETRLKAGNDLEWATRGSNYRDFRHLMKRWSEKATRLMKDFV